MQSKSRQADKTLGDCQNKNTNSSSQMIHDAACLSKPHDPVTTILISRKFTDPKALFWENHIYIYICTGMQRAPYGKFS